MRKQKQIALLAAAVASMFGVNRSFAVDGTFNDPTGGSYEDTSNWLGGTVAEGVGATARFVADITDTPGPVLPTVTLGAGHVLGNLVFQDTATGSAATNGDWILAGSPLTLNSVGTPTINVINRTAFIDLSLEGSQGFAKVLSNGTLTLRANNAISGDIRSDRGPIRLFQNGSLLNASNITMSGSELELNNNSAIATGGTPVNLGDRLGNATPITLAGGFLRFVGATDSAGNGVAASETVGVVSLRGGNEIRSQAVTGAAPGLAPAVLTLAGLQRINNNALTTPASSTATVNFDSIGTFGAGGPQIFITGQAAGFMGGWAVAGAQDFAEYSETAGVQILSATGRPTAIAGATSGQNVRITAKTATVAPSASTTFNSLVIRTGAPTANETQVVDLGGQVVNLESGGIIRASAQGNTNNAAAVTVSSTISSGTLTAGGAAPGNLYIYTDAPGTGVRLATSEVRISAGIVDNGGPLALVKSGPGNLYLEGTDKAHTGGTFVQGGALHVNGATQLGGTVVLTGNVAGLQDSVVNFRADTGSTFGQNGNALDVEVEGDATINGGRITTLETSLTHTLGQLRVTNPNGRFSTTITMNAGPGLDDGTGAASNANASLTFTEGPATIAVNTEFNIAAARGTGVGIMVVPGITDGAGTFGVTKSGAGTLQISGPSDYGGGTTVTAGLMTVTPTGDLGGSPVSVTGGTFRVNSIQTNAVGNVTVSNGTFGGSGRVFGSVAMLAGNLGPGNLIGTLDIDGSLSLGATTTLTLDVRGNQPIDASNGYDQVNAGGDITVTPGANIVGINITGFTPAVGDAFYLLNQLNPASPTVGELTFAGNSLSEGEVFTVGAQQWSLTYQANWTGDQLTSTTTGGNDVALVAVPEPTSIALIALGATGLLARRRRRAN